MHLARLMANPATVQDFPSTLFYVITDILKIFIKKRRRKKKSRFRKPYFCMELKRNPLGGSAFIETMHICKGYHMDPHYCQYKEQKYTLVYIDLVLLI